MCPSAFRSGWGDRGVKLGDRWSEGRRSVVRRQEIGGQKAGDQWSEGRGSVVSSQEISGQKAGDQ